MEDVTCFLKRIIERNFFKIHNYYYLQKRLTIAVNLFCFNILYKQLVYLELHHFRMALSEDLKYNFRL